RLLTRRLLPILQAHHSSKTPGLAGQPPVFQSQTRNSPTPVSTMTGCWAIQSTTLSAAPAACPERGRLLASLLRRAPPRKSRPHREGNFAPPPGSECNRRESRDRRRGPRLARPYGLNWRA